MLTELFSAVRKTTHEQSSDEVVVFDIILVNQGHIFNSSVFSPKSNSLFLIHFAAGVSKHLYQLNITLANSARNTYYQLISNSQLSNSSVSCNCIIPVTSEDKISVMSKSSLFSDVNEQTRFVGISLNNVMSTEVYMQAGFSGDFRQYNSTHNKLQVSLNEAKRYIFIRVPYEAIYVMVATIRYTSSGRTHNL